MDTAARDLSLDDVLYFFVAVVSVVTLFAGF
jgi:hypothetical protein